MFRDFEWCTTISRKEDFVGIAEVGVETSQCTSHREGRDIDSLTANNKEITDSSPNITKRTLQSL